MNSPERTSNSRLLDEDHLTQLQLKIARRADELAQSHTRAHDSEADRSYWLEAEREVLEVTAEAVPS